MAESVEKPSESLNGPMINHKPRAHCLPLEQRIRLYEEVLQLREQGLSYSQIIERVRWLSRLQLNKTRVSQWVRGLNSPLGNVNRFDAKPSTELAYIIGVRFGDGYITNQSNDHRFELKVTDYDFAMETGRTLPKLLGRKEHYLPRWDKWIQCWHTLCCSILFYQFLEQPLENLKQYIEHCSDCVAAFLRGIFDSEGCIKRRALTVYNTDTELLPYVQRLLRQHFDIETTGPHRSAKVGYRFRDPRNGRTYETKKQCYYVYVRAHSLPLFFRHVGFSLRRKQLRLAEAIQG